MNRVIKFRAWDKNAKKMYYAQEVAIALDGSLHIEADDWYYTFHDNKGYTIDWLELMQSIGLIDKNGQEIYEGDGIIIDLNSRKKTKTFTVAWAGSDMTKPFDRARWGLLDSDGNWNSFEDAKYMQVIGNIYENPELTKGQI